MKKSTGKGGRYLQSLARARCRVGMLTLGWWEEIIRSTWLLLVVARDQVGKEELDQIGGGGAFLSCKQ